MSTVIKPIFFSLLLLYSIKPYAQVLPQAQVKQKSNSETKKTNAASQKKKATPITPAQHKFLLKILCDIDAKVMVDGENKGSLQAGTVFKLPLTKGVYQIKLASLKNPVSETRDAYRVEGEEDQDLWNVSLKEKEDGYYTTEIVSILNSCLLSSYYGQTGNGYSIRLKNSISIKGGKIELTKTTTQSDAENKVFDQTTYTEKMYSGSIRDCYFDPVLPEYIKFSGTTYELNLVGDGAFFNSYNNSESNSSAMTIPIRPECKDELENKMKHYLRNLNLPVKPRGISCSGDDLSDILEPVVVKSYSKTEKTGYKFSRFTNYSVLDKILKFTINNKMYDKAGKLYSDEDNFYLLDLNSVWGFEIESAGSYLSEFGVFQNIRIKGNVSTGEINNMNKETKVGKRNFSLLIPIETSSRDELEKQLNSCFTKNN